MVGVGMVVLFAAFSGGGRQPVSAPAVVPVAQAAPQEKPDAARSVEAIRQPLLAMLDADPAADETELQEKFKQARIRRLEFLIVTLPDPIDASLGYAFDEAVNTLQTAVGTQGFLIDRFYLPWHGLTAKSNNGTVPVYQSEPGVVLFRRRAARSKHGQGTELLLVYIVGETPIAGIHQRAFDRTIEEIEYLSGIHAQVRSVVDAAQPDATPSEPDQSESVAPAPTFKPDRPIVRVVGSTFSGSADSLAHSMARAQQFQFEVISGSASNVSLPRIRELSQGTLKSFASVRIPARLAFLAAIRFLDESRRSRQPLRIAWLHEANTSFGSWLTEFKGKPINEGGLSLEMTTFPFPLHLSKIRSLMGATANRGLFDVPGENQTLQLNFEHDLESRDSVPQMTPGMTNPTTELVLSRILATIKEQGFKYVGITATDSQDRVFLCERMREYCPDVQIVVDFSHRIFTHPRYRSFMKGTLVASTYPMYVETQKWCYPNLAARKRSKAGEEKPFQVFRQLAMSNELLPGLFNATVLSLESAMPGRHDGKTLPLIDYGEPFIDSLFRDREMSPRYVPPLWISVVGNGTLQPLRYWPLREMLKYEGRVLDIDQDSAATSSQDGRQLAGVLPDVTLRPPSEPVILELGYTMPGRAFLVWVLGVSGIMTWMLGRTRYDPTVHRPDATRVLDPDARQTVHGMLWGLLVRRADPLLRRRQTFWLLALVLPSWLLLTYCSIASLVPLLVDAVQSNSLDSVQNFVLLVIAAAAGGPALILEYRRRQLVEQKPGTSVGVGLMAVVVVLVMIGSGASLFFESSRYLSHAVLATQLIIGTWLASQMCGLMYDMREDAGLVRGYRAGGVPQVPVRAAYTDKASALHVWTLVTGGLVHFLAILFVAGMLELPLALSRASDLTGQHILWFERTYRVTSGVSWIVPASLVIAAILFWVLSRLARLFTMDRSRPMPPWPCGDACPIETTGLEEAIQDLNRTQDAIEDVLLDPCQALRTTAGAAFGGVFLLTIIVLTLIAQEATSCFEGSGHTLILWGALSFLIVIWIYWIWELGWMIWLMRKLLRQIAWLPMTAAFLRVPERIRSVLGRFLAVRSPHQSHLRIRVQYLQELADHAADHKAELTTGSWPVFTPSEFTSVDKQFATDLKELRRLDEQGGSALPTMTATIEMLNRAGSQLWNGLLHEWTTRDVLENYPCSIDTEFKKSGDETGFEGWKNRAEELTAIQIRAYITGYAAQLRHLLMTAMFSTILFLMAVLSYPMQPRSLLTSLAMIMVATISLMATWVTVQFDRDEFLRRIQGQNSTGRQYDMQFWFRTLTWLAPAIMVVISAIFPNAWDWLYTLLEPVLSATN